MSMLIRTGTLVRKSSRKATIRRTRSAGSTTSGSHARPLDNDGLSSTNSSVPGSPIAKLHHLYTEPCVGSSPGKVSVATTSSTVVSYEDHRHIYKTTLDRTYSTDQASYTTNQDTVLQIEEAKKEADNICDFLCSTSHIICSSTFITSAVAISMIVPVVMIALGVKFLDDCPLEPKIPIFHLVGGCFWLLKCGITLWRSIQQRHQGSLDNLYDSVSSQRGVTTRTYRTMDVLLSLFLLAWHILGTIWVLGIWRPRFKALLHRPSQWCERSLYFFSIAIIVAVYAVAVLVLLGMCCLTCLYKNSSTNTRHR